MEQDVEAFDRDVRHYVYDVTMGRGYPPSLAGTAEHFGRAVDQVRAAFQRLAAGRVLVLQPESSEILMANPFSAVPTPFLVETDSYTCYGNCIWDALGIPAMLQQDARIVTSCSDCGAALEVNVVNGAVQGEGILHFAIPVLNWWGDIVFA